MRVLSIRRVSGRARSQRRSDRRSSQPRIRRDVLVFNEVVERCVAFNLPTPDRLNRPPLGTVVRLRPNVQEDAARLRGLRDPPSAFEVAGEKMLADKPWWLSLGSLTVTFSSQKRWMVRMGPQVFPARWRGSCWRPRMRLWTPVSHISPCNHAVKSSCHFVTQQIAASWMSRTLQTPQCWMTSPHSGCFNDCART